MKIIAQINIIAVRASSLARDQYYLIARDQYYRRNQNHLVDIGLKNYLVGVGLASEDARTTGKMKY